MKTSPLIILSALLFSGCWSLQAASAPRFTKEQLKLPGKKGACFTLKQADGKLSETGAQNMTRVKALNVSWNYSWNTHYVAEQPKDIEFAVADWKTGGDIKKNRHTSAKILTFMKEVLPWLEKQEWIIGYAWFSFKPDSAPGAPSALFDEAGNLTACGRYYKSVTPQNPKGDQTIKPDPIQ